MKTKTHTLLLAALTVAVIVAVFHAVASIAPVLAETIRSSSIYAGNNIAGDVLLTLTMIVLTISVISIRDARIIREKNRALRAQRDSLSAQCDSLRTERNALRTERDALRTERNALRTERDALRTERNALRTERDSYVRFTVALDETLQRKSDTIASLENKILEWSNRYYALRSRLLSK